MAAAILPTDASLSSSITALILAALVITGSPGPSIMSATAVGAAFGFRHALSYVSGLMAGTTVVLLAVAAGLLSLLLSLPRMATALVTISVVYITYLAFRIATAPPLSSNVELPRAPSFGGGFLLAVANPKAFIAIAAVFASNALPLPDASLAMLLELMILFVAIVAIHAVWLMAGASLSRFLQQPRISRVANVIFAALLLATTAQTVISRL